MVDRNNDVKSDPYLDLFRMTEKQLMMIASIINEKTVGERTDQGRQDERLGYQQVGKVQMEMEQPGGYTKRFQIMPRDLSRSGLGFLHAAYAHQGTRCTFRLQATNGEFIVIRGLVQRCQHLKGAVHDVGIRFEQAIDLSRVVDRSDATCESDG